jgi:hypothetical protein
MAASLSSCIHKLQCSNLGQGTSYSDRSFFVATGDSKDNTCEQATTTSLDILIERTLTTNTSLNSTLCNAASGRQRIHYMAGQTNVTEPTDLCIITKSVT